MRIKSKVLFKENHTLKSFLESTTIPEKKTIVDVPEVDKN